MNKAGVLKIVKTVQKGLSKHSPEILTGLGIIGMVTTTVLAVKATPKALELIEKAKEEKQEELTKVEVVKTAYKPYIPAAVTGVVAATCVISAHKVNAGRITSLATAYQLSTAALSEYKDKVIETVGEEKAKEIKEKIVQEKVDANPLCNNEVIITGKGKELCLDYMSGRYFESDINVIDKAANTINHRILMGGEMYASLNEFYSAIGLSDTGSGKLLGWNVDRPIEMSYTTCMTDDNRSCIVVGFLYEPTYDYDKLY